LEVDLFQLVQAAFQDICFRGIEVSFGLGFKQVQQVDQPLDKFQLLKIIRRFQVFDFFESEKGLNIKRCYQGAEFHGRERRG